MMENFFRSVPLVLIISLLLHMFQATAFSQTGGEDEFFLEEITVTAQKREENKQKTAITMDVITGEDVKQIGRKNLDDILSTLSSVTIKKSADGYRVAIRGVDDYIAPLQGMQITTPTVAVNTDGVYSNRNDAGSFFDLERVEVLYGPQSTMYTSTSPGGIVNVVTASPKLETYEASGSIEFGSYELLHTEGVVNVPVGENFALRAAFSTTVHDGYLSNGAEGEDEKAARLKGLYQAGENLSFQVTGEITKSGGTGFAGGVEPFIDESDKDDPWAGNDNGSLGSNDQTNKKLKGSMDLDLSIGSLSIIPSYSKGDGEWDMTMTDRDGESYDQHALQESEEKSIELRMSSSPDLFFKWIAGITYYESTDSNQRLSADFEETGEGYWAKRTMEEEASAFFGNVTYPVMDALRFTLGYRYSNDELVSVNEEWTMNPLDGSIWTEYGLWRTENLTENDGRSDYKVGFEYDLADNSMLYGDYSTSYRVQGGQSGGEWPCEELIAYTLGAKNRFMDNQLQVNIGAYYYDYQNFFARQMLMFQADNGDMVMEPNASQYGDGRMIGFDLQASFIITPKDRVNLSVSYIDSEWTDLYFDYFYDDEYTDASYNGKPMKNTPPWTVNASYNRRFSLPNGGDLTGRVDLKYQTGYRLTWMDDDYPYNWQETHFMGDLSAVYTSPDGKWTLSGYVKNVTDYAEKRMYNSAGDASLSIGNPRTYGAVFTVRY